ncbi:MAG: 50S ribosomal protein L24 [Planctomycetales bacterium]|nr:50S ribosomal protein L24 [Planctomycetales bacterium]
MRLKVGDVVQVVAGDDKGTRGKIVRTDREKNKIVVEGVNRAYKHVKRGHPKAPQGGRLSIEMAINASNAMLIDPTTDKPTRTRIQLPKTKDEPKLLVAKSGAVLRRIGKDPSATPADS